MMAQIPTTKPACNGKKFGMPDYFLILTVDEANSLRWEDITHFEHRVQKIEASLTWKDYLVECAFLFHA